MRGTRLGITLITLLCLCGIRPALSQEPAHETDSQLPTPDQLEAEGAEVGEIVVQVGDIFNEDDPAENYRLYRWVNRLHRKTRDRVIRQQLLFRSGDRLSTRALAESERLLRSRRYLYDAEIRPLAYDGRTVDLEVAARDVWTLSGGVRFRRTGGENRTQFELQDFNFLGTGKELTVNHTTDVDRDSSLFRYRDSNLFGSRREMELWLSENSDGYLRLLDLERPFYSLDTQRAAGIRWYVEDRVDSRYRLGEVRDRFRHRTDFVEGYWGLSPGFAKGRTRRLRLGFTYEKALFFQPPAEDPAPDQLPFDRKLAYPWISYEVVEDGFVELQNLDRMARTEDLNLGRRLSARLGWSSPTFGADGESAIVDLKAKSGRRFADSKLLLTSAYASGRWSGDGWENLRLGGSARFYWRNFGDHLLYLLLHVDAAHNLDPELQLLLGGDSGLRGYPLRYQEGDRRFLVTLEQRFFSDWNPFRLANVGAAVFVDFGRGWFIGPQDEETDRGVLRDVGFGLRIGSARSSRGTMVHLDVAFPLDRDGSIDDVQWLVTTKDSF